MFAPVYQNGYIVHDLSPAIERWLQLGAGPFFTARVEFEHYVHRGVQSHPVLDLALGNSGDLQIELIRQVNDAPSAYREFMEIHGSGLQHVSALSANFDSDKSIGMSKGLEVITEGVLLGGIRVVFFDTDLRDGSGMMMELLERTEAVRMSTEFIREAARNWDGSDPIRSFG